MMKLSNFVLNHRRGLWVVNVLVIITLFSFLPRNELNDEFVKYVSEDTQFRQSTEFVADNLTGIYFIDYSLNAGGEGNVADPDFLIQLEAFANWLREQPEVGHVASILEIMYALNRDMHGGETGWYRLPDSRELAAQYLLLYEMSLPFGLDLNDRINLDKSATRLTVTMKNNLSTREFIDFENRANQWLLYKANSIYGPGSSPSMMFTHIGERNIKQMLIGASLALILISLILVLTLGSWRIGMLSLLPNIAPAGLAFGLWGLLSGRIGLGLSMVASLTIGIVVDNTIHFLSRYLWSRRNEGANATGAVQSAFIGVGKVVLASNIILLVGFITLALSDFTPNAELAVLTSITLLFALATDLFMLPILLLWLDQESIPEPLPVANGDPQ